MKTVKLEKWEEGIKGNRIREFVSLIQIRCERAPLYFLYKSNAGENFCI
jgi:hypothetical protein